jgi:8-oxo-dGTP diphosphatase
MNAAAAELRPLVGIGVIVLREGRVLLGQRLGSHGACSWALPGGHLEFGEEIEDAARREVLEETALRLAALRRGPYTNNVFAHDGKHYVTLFVVAEAAGGEARLCEPAKCAGWQWFDWAGLPQPLFAPLQSLVASGYRPGPVR